MSMFHVKEGEYVVNENNNSTKEMQESEVPEKKSMEDELSAILLHDYIGQLHPPKHWTNESYRLLEKKEKSFQGCGRTEFVSCPS